MGLSVDFIDVSSTFQADGCRLEPCRARQSQSVFQRAALKVLTTFEMILFAEAERRVGRDQRVIGGLTYRRAALYLASARLQSSGVSMSWTSIGERISGAVFPVMIRCSDMKLLTWNQ